MLLFSVMPLKYAIVTILQAQLKYSFRRDILEHAEDPKDIMALTVQM